MEEKAFPLCLGETGKIDVVISQTPEQTYVIKALYYNKLMSLDDIFTKCLHDKRDVLSLKC